MRHEWDLRPEMTLREARAGLVAELNDVLDSQDAAAVLEHALRGFTGQVAMVSSFGADSAVLLHLVARIAPETPVLFVDTLLLFKETLAYQNELAAKLGLLDVRVIRGDATVRRLSDPHDDLHLRAPDDCCYLRKTLPLQTALIGFDGWITGRKRHQTEARADMDVVELDSAGRIKFNPLANWSAQDIDDYRTTHKLPPHPLVAQNYLSIGCAPCTQPVEEGADPRSGRWQGQIKTECGIHFGPQGAVRRLAKETTT